MTQELFDELMKNSACLCGGWTCSRCKLALEEVRRAFAESLGASGSPAQPDNPLKVLGDEAWAEEALHCKTKKQMVTLLRAFAANMKAHHGATPPAASSQACCSGRNFHSNACPYFPNQARTNETIAPAASGGQPQPSRILVAQLYRCLDRLSLAIKACAEIGFEDSTPTRNEHHAAIWNNLNEAQKDANLKLKHFRDRAI